MYVNKMYTNVYRLFSKFVISGKMGYLKFKTIDIIVIGMHLYYISFT